MALAPRNNACGSSSQYPTKVRGRRAKWDNYATEIFCRVCAEEINEGNIDGKHLSKRGWANVKKKFNERLARGYEYKQLKNKWENLKCLWNKWKNLVGPTTGVGCNFEKGIDADDDWWESQIQGCPQAVKSYLQRIPNFEDMCIMFSKTRSIAGTDWCPRMDTLPGEAKNTMEGSGDSDELADNVMITRSTQRRKVAHPNVNMDQHTYQTSTDESASSKTREVSTADILSAIADLIMTVEQRIMPIKANLLDLNNAKTGTGWPEEETMCPGHRGHKKPLIIQLLCQLQG